MADYWKSNPRKFCEVCKCWFADNRASIEFHEGGQRHQANVRKKLQEARSRSAANEKEKVNLAKVLNTIENAAFSAYQQDLAGGPAKKAKPNVADINQAQQTHREEQAAEQAKLEREMEKKMIEVHAQQKIQEIQAKAALEARAALYAWQQCYSPEGYVYYYNNVTGVSQWEVPKEFSQFTPSIQPPAQTAPSQVTISPSTTPSIVPPASSSPSSKSLTSVTSLEPVKRPPDNAEPDKCDYYPPPKRRTPYGQWTTVTIIERDNVKEDKEREEEEEEEEETGVQFEEKTLTGGLGEEEENGSGEVKGEFKGFTFKKRTKFKERPQARQRTSDI